MTAPRNPQRGMTLIVSLIMLVVLTLLVVAAMRFGNLNLKISGNVQSEVEATAAAQVAVEQVIAEVVAGGKIDDMATHNVSVSTGAVTYTVVVSKPVCNSTANIKNSTLNPEVPADQKCIGTWNGPCIVDSTGECVIPPTICKNQQWDIAAAVDDTSRNGARVNVGQGAAMRVNAAVQCP